MSHSTILVERLIKALQCLPGVGPRSARRMCFHLLKRDRNAAERLSQALSDVLKQITYCERCGNFSQSQLCDLCASEKRDQSILCVLETPADLEAMERCNVYKGVYFLLMGRLSAVEAIGPEELRIPLLVERLKSGQVSELILAMNTTSEGDATCDFLADVAAPVGIKITRLARGLPVGSELEHLDQATLREAYLGRFTPSS